MLSSILFNAFMGFVFIYIPTTAVVLFIGCMAAFCDFIYERDEILRMEGLGFYTTNKAKMKAIEMYIVKKKRFFGLMVWPIYLPHYFISSHLSAQKQIDDIMSAAIAESAMEQLEKLKKDQAELERKMRRS